MIRRNFGLAMGMALLVGCTTGTKAPIKSGGGEKLQLQSVTVKDEEQTPSVSMSPDLLYLLLVAEITGQRGDHKAALNAYIEAANRTRDAKVAERATQIAMYVNDMEKASQAVSLWIERDADNLSARKFAVIVFLKKSDEEKALENLKVFLSLREEVDRHDNFLIEVIKLLDKQDVDGLLFMQDVAESFPGMAEIHYAYSLLARSKKKLELALKEVSKAVSLNAGWTSAKVLQAQIIAQLGNEEAAQNVLVDALEGEPNNTKLRMVYAQFLVNTKDYLSAENEYQRVLEQDPHKYDAIFALALIQLQLKQEELAQNTLLKLVNVPKWQARSYLYLGRIEANRKNVRKALSWFEKVGSGPMVFDAQINIVSVLINDNQTDKAFQLLSGLRSRFPSEAVRLHLIKADFLAEKKGYKAAFASLSEALQEFPGEADLLYSRALVAENLDRLDVLEADLKAILVKDPKAVNALNALGYTLADRTTRFDEARGYLEKAKELKPEDPAVIDSYGWLQYRLGKLGLALEYLRRAYNGDQDPEIAAHLGEVLWVMGEKSEAKSIWKKMREDDPEGEHITDIEQRFPDAFEE